MSYGIESLVPPQSLQQGVPQQDMPQQGMPQGPQPRQGIPMPPQNDPSMSAAMDLATDELDALDLDPRTKAMLKTQEAYDLMQSAQRELAMAQQQPVPPTIEGQRTQQTMQGISALTQQLSPGIQQQGQQMAMAQRRPPMQGQRPPMQGQRPPTPQQRPPMQGQRPPTPQQGLSGMPARNMMKAAQGGVVGYAGPDGSQVQSQAPQRPIAGQPSAAVPDQAALVAQFLAAYATLQADLKAAKPQEKDLFQQRVQDLIDTTPPSVVNAAFGQGMARGGIVGFAGPDGSQVESKGQMGSGRGELNRARREASAEAMRNSPEWKRQQRIKEIRYETGADMAGAIAQYEAELAAGAPPSVQVERTQPAGTQFQTDTRSPQLRAFPQRPSSLIDDSSVGIATGGAGSPQSDIDATLSSIAALTVPETKIEDLARSPLRGPIEEAALKNIKLDASALSEDARKTEQGLASQAYAMSPEMKAAYARKQQESDAAYAAQLDPKRLKDQKINALLAGFATPGGISTSGIAALQGVTGVDTTAAELGRKQSEERFGSVKEREGINREGRIKGYEAGSRKAQAVYERTSATVNQASQSLSQLATSDETRGQAAAVQEYTRQMDGLKLQLNVFLQKEKISQDDRRNLQRIVADMRNAQSDIDNSITDIQNSMILYDADEKAAAVPLIQAAKAQKDIIQQQINTTLTRLGIGVAVAPSGGGGDVIDFTDL